MVQLNQLMRLLDSQSEASWSGALFDVAESLGFTSVMYAALPSKHANIEHSFLQRKYSKDWRVRDGADKLNYVDLTVENCMPRVLRMVWRPDAFAGEGQLALY